MQSGVVQAEKEPLTILEYELIEDAARLLGFRDYELYGSLVQRKVQAGNRDSTVLPCAAAAVAA